MSIDNIDNFGSDSSLNQNETLSTNHLHDPIIQRMLQDRILDADSTLTLDDELERQRRMYVMLRNSKKYRKLQVQEANLKEKNSNLLDLKSIEEACDSIQVQSFNAELPKRSRKVSFSATNRIITFQHLDTDDSLENI